MLRVRTGPFHPTLESSLVDDVRRLKASDPLAPIALVVPSQLLIDRLRRLFALDARLPLLNVHFLTFHQLVLKLTAERSLDEEVSEPADDEEDPLRDAWTEPGGYPQTVELAELVAGQPGVDAWDRPGAEGNSLSAAPGKLPRDQRQALVWHLIDGFSVAEIADFQARPTAEIEEDLRRAQQALERELDAASFEKLEARLTSARRRTRGRP